MFQVQQQQQQQQQSPSPSKVSGSCFKCNKPGHWAMNCPESPLNRSPISPQSVITTSDIEYPASHCRCGAGLCEFKVSRSTRNPCRKYYCCPGKFEKHCGYFKWCDQMTKEEIRTVKPQNFPMCGCGAGMCSIQTVEYGINAGRCCFICPIKKGDGACNFIKWIDNSPESTSFTADGPISDRSSDCVSDQFLLNDEAEMQIDALQMVGRENPAEEIQFHIQGEEDGTVGGVFERPRETPKAHPEVVQYNIQENLHPNLTIHRNSMVENRMQDFQMNNVQAAGASVITTFENAISEASLPDLKPAPEDNVLFPAVAPNSVSRHLDTPSSSRLLLNPLNILKEGNDGCVMTGTILQAFEKLAQHVKNKLITLLESMSPHNHESMRKEADCAYAALDHLQVDYGLFQLKVDEYIKQASSLSHIEQIISHTQELVDHYENEQRRFDEIFKAYNDANDACMSSNSQLRLLFERANCVKDGLVELHKELSSCEMEIKSRQNKLREITKTMVESRESLQAASLKATEARKNSENMVKELSAVKAAFQKARAELRN